MKSIFTRKERADLIDFTNLPTVEKGAHPRLFNGEAAEAGKEAAVGRMVIGYSDFCNRVSAWHPVFLRLGLAIKNFFQIFQKNKFAFGP